MGLKIKKDDIVEIIAGKDIGARGKVLQVLPARNRVIVEKVNYIFKHQKPRQQQRGGILQIEAPIHVSNVMVVSPGDDEPTRVGFRVNDSGEKVRYCKRTGEQIDK